MFSNLTSPPAGPVNPDGVESSQIWHQNSSTQYKGIVNEIDILYTTETIFILK